ncbi:hypothetical protein E0L36_22210 [Streptomyces sp. AJS327]|uniref:hypothetical protein n=1 Tax=Streptomyces sp. AJS327 TaxID=2545265 RepID=UPI0015DD5682|nr:hypothetical protein [Streptomyces sp. AJS327]MBA0053492.1 hypothetical protein [Streptomyces sp. AJS327]
MNALAVIVLVVWAVGIPLGAAATVVQARQDPWLSMAFHIRPVAVGLYCALLVVWWPATVLAALLLHVSGQGARR